MKKRILSAVLVSGVTLSAAASVHAEDYDSQIAAADNAISNLHKRKLLQSNLKYLHLEHKNQNWKLKMLNLKKYQQIWNLKFKNYQVKL